MTSHQPHGASPAQQAVSEQFQATSPSTIPAAAINTTSAWNSAVAGYAAGVTGVVIGHPMDSVKVWLQTNTTGTNKHFSSLSSTSSPNGSSTKTSASSCTASSNNTTPSRAGGAGRARAPSAAYMSTLARQSVSKPTILAQPHQVWNAIRASYSGVSGPLVTVGIVQSVNFAIYDTMRRVLYQPADASSSNNYLTNDSLSNVATAGFVAGTGLACLTCPLIQIKTRQQITGSGFREAFRETFLNSSNGGGRLLSLRTCCGVGLYPHFISETFGRALYYAVYEGTKRSIGEYRNQQHQPISLQDRMLSAGFAGVVCWAFIFPFDALRSRLYHAEIMRQEQGGSKKVVSTLEMAKKMRIEGSFYRGFWLTVLRAGPVAAVVLPVYDMVLEHMSS